MPRSVVRSMFMLRASTGNPVLAETTAKTLEPISSSKEEIDAGGTPFFFTSEAVSAASTTSDRTSESSSLRKATICRRVRRVPRCSGPTAGASGMRSCNVERISTRLMESMPRSESISMSRFKMSAGYPVFSATTSRRTTSTLPVSMEEAEEAEEAGEAAIGISAGGGAGAAAGGGITEGGGGAGAAIRTCGTGAGTGVRAGSARGRGDGARPSLCSTRRCCWSTRD